MYLKPNASKLRQREAQNARENRAEITKALSQGQISKRDLVKWGIFTGTGMLAAKHGLSPFAQSAFAKDTIPTGAPRSPLFGAQKFTQPLKRLNLQKPQPLRHTANPSTNETECQFPSGLNEPNAKRLSWHTDFNQSGGQSWRNPRTGVGPMEGRPWGEWFAHQRWNEFTPQVGYVMSIGQISDNTAFHPQMAPHQDRAARTVSHRGFATRCDLQDRQKLVGSDERPEY